MICDFDADNVCLSGGAEGSDLLWGHSAKRRGDEVIHFIFNGHKSKAAPEEKVVLTHEQLLHADPYLHRANETLERNFPSRSSFVNNLLRRNYYQVAWSDSLYGISEIGRDQLVKGGTSWAVQMFIDLHPDKYCYIFDQVKKQWFQWKGAWFPIIHPPAPQGIWAGIGSREINEAGKKAIGDLMGCSRDKPLNLPW